MPVCSFFLQDRCRFGENCKFEHPRGGSGGGNGSAQRNLFGGSGGGGGQRVTFRDSFGTSGNQAQGGNSFNQFKWNAGQQTQGAQGAPQTSSMDLVNGLPKEMDAWEKTKMWPFSCVSVEKELPCLPEFHDISIEEVRLEAYEAQKSGNMQPFNQKLQGLVLDYQNKRNQLKQMSMEVKQKLAAFLEDARRKKTNQSVYMTSSVFGSATPSGQTGQSLFGKPAANPPSAGLFGQAANPPSTGLFGQTSPGTTGGLFGKPAGQPTLFGSSPGFGSNPSSTSLFGKPQSATTPSLFGSPQTPQTGSSLFGGGQNMANAAQAVTPNQSGAGMFGSGGQQLTAPSLFGSAGGGSSSIFGTPATGQQTASSVFGNFGSAAGAGNASTPGQGLFGKPAGAGLLGAAPNPSTPSSGLFGVSSSTPPTGLFGKPAPIVPSGLFGGGQAAPSMGGGLLPTPSTVGTGLFGKGIQPAVNSSTSPGFGVFGNSAAQGSNATQGGSVFGGGGGSDSSKDVTTVTTGSSVSLDSVHKGRFSTMDELSPQDIEAFKANSFTLGKIPIKPPPKELVVF